MDKDKKTLRKPLSAIDTFHCVECKAKVAGEAQKSLAREVLRELRNIAGPLVKLRDLMKEIIG